jgi:HTH-type transcriptional regulator/antitoxin HigA
MIATEREYAVSRGRRRELLAVRATYLAQPQEDPSAQDWLVASVDSVLARVDAEIGEYEALRAGSVLAVPVAGLGDLPGALVQARIAAGLTQRQLAERLAVAEQAVQRDEAGGYARATLDRLQRVAEALGLEVEGVARFRPREDTARASD